MSEREPHAGGEQEQRPVGGVEDETEQEVAQGEQTREREREVKAAEARRSGGGTGSGGWAAPLVAGTTQPHPGTPAP